MVNAPCTTVIILPVPVAGSPAWSRPVHPDRRHHKATRDGPRPVQPIPQPRQPDRRLDDEMRRRTREALDNAVPMRSAMLAQACLQLRALPATT
jgi:hypothetical protein